MALISSAYVEPPRNDMGNLGVKAEFFPDSPSILTVLVPTKPICGV